MWGRDARMLILPGDVQMSVAEIHTHTVYSGYIVLFLPLDELWIGPDWTGLAET